MSCRIYTAEEHVQVYDLWRRRGDRDVAVCHIDFHCDMRGLLLDRRRAVVWPIDRRDRRMSEADSGNFMAHAILQGIVTALRWVHDPFGGRQFDTGTVKYETDLTALPHRLLHHFRPGPEVPLRYAELTFDEWQGLLPGEQFDIDWDGIAAIDYEVSHIRRLMDTVLERDWAVRPTDVFLIDSPGYSHPDRSLYDEFLARLQERLDAEVEALPPYSGPPHLAAATGPIEALEKRVVLGLRRLGIY